ncbi:unnamed protein product [Rhizophagus irregularis]|nr:unnamed protein product [Rhizophagus irregularis]
MSIERTSKKHSRSEDDNHIEFIDIIDIEKLTPDDTNNGTLNEYMKNAFNELLNNKEESDSLKSKGNNGENCTMRIETLGSTATTPSQKQTKISNYTVSSISSNSSQITQDQQKYLETLLFEWLILDFH